MPTYHVKDNAKKLQTKEKIKGTLSKLTLFKLTNKRKQTNKQTNKKKNISKWFALCGTWVRKEKLYILSHDFNGVGCF